MPMGRVDTLKLWESFMKMVETQKERSGGEIQDDDLRSVADLILQELSRQVFVHCAERGMLLEYLRLQLNEHTNRLQQSLVEEQSYNVSLQAELEESERLLQGKSLEKPKGKVGAQLKKVARANLLMKMPFAKSTRELPSAERPKWGAPGLDELHKQVRELEKRLQTSEACLAEGKVHHMTIQKALEEELATAQRELKKAQQKQSRLARMRSTPHDGDVDGPELDDNFLQTLEDELSRYRKENSDKDKTIDRLNMQMEARKKEADLLRQSIAANEVKAREDQAARDEHERQQRQALLEAAQGKDQLLKTNSNAGGLERELRAQKAIEAELRAQLELLQSQLEEEARRASSPKSGKRTPKSSKNRSNESSRPVSKGSAWDGVNANKVMTLQLETQLRSEIAFLKSCDFNQQLEIKRLMELVDKLGDSKMNKAVYKEFADNMDKYKEEAMAALTEKPEVIQLKERIKELEEKNRLLSQQFDDLNKDLRLVQAEFGAVISTLEGDNKALKLAAEIMASRFKALNADPEGLQKAIQCPKCSRSFEERQEDIEDEVQAALVIQKNWKLNHKDKPPKVGKSEIDNHLVKIEGKTLAWLKKLQSSLYVAKVVADKADDNKQNRRQSVDEFFCGFAKTTWGGGKKRGEMLQITVETIKRYRFSCDDVMCLNNFLSGKWDISIQSTYLLCLMLQGEAKHKAPRQRVVLESSWHVIMSHTLGALDQPLVDFAHEMLCLAWEANGSQTDPREDNMKLVPSDVYRATVCRIHATIDELFGILLVSVFEFLAGSVPEEGWPLMIDKLQFSQLLRQLEVSIGLDQVLWEMALHLTEATVRAKKSVSLKGLIGVAEKEPCFKAAYRQHYTQLTQQFDVVTAEASARYHTVRKRYYQVVYQKSRDCTEEHTDFIQHLGEALDNGDSCYSDSHWGDAMPRVENPQARLQHEIHHMRKHVDKKLVDIQKERFHHP